jgi:protein O-GlcNAc transferase
MANEQELGQANGLLGAGRVADAIAILNRVVAKDPREHRALHMLGVALAQSGNLAEGEQALRKAVALAPKSGALLTDFATVLILAKRSGDALPMLAQARALEPSLTSAMFYQGVALTNLDRPAEALVEFDALAKREPKNPLVLQNRATLLLKLGRADEALVAVNALIAAAPNHLPGASLKASILIELNRFNEAIDICDRAIAREPRFAEAHAARGVALSRLGDTNAAAAAFNRGTTLNPALGDAWLNLARLERTRGGMVAAIEAYDRFLAISADHIDAAFERAVARISIGDVDGVANDLRALYERAPDLDYLLGMYIHAKALVCDWNGIGEPQSKLHVALDAGKLASPPFPLLALDVGPMRLRDATTQYANKEFPSAPTFPPRRAGGNDRIRVAYLSGEFRDQATAYLMAEVYESHDRDRFEVVAIDIGANDNGSMRARLEKAFGHIEQMSGASDAEIARLLVDRNVDIALNLNGYFGQGRTGVFAMRPCPIQINYLGYPGTLGADYYDYIIGDRHVIPPGAESSFVEDVVRLPDCYQPNDSRRAIATTKPSRRELGLPESGFVFCCFNNNHKIEPAMFKIWARLLHAIDGSVLWLVIRNETAQRNLREEARARGIDPSRLVFAPYAKLDAHLARHVHADLFLDTLPHNAHTTASDALWAGVPLLTCVGDTFAGRVAASLLHTVGLPELVTTSLADYEALALRLAREPALLRAYRDRLSVNRATSALFDGRRHATHLERAFEIMVEKSRRGEAPAGFDVEALEDKSS